MPSPGVHPGSGQGPPLVTDVLDPVLTPLGFAPGQVSVDAKAGQVIFCRGAAGSPDGACVDLVLDVEAAPSWRITDVRYGASRATDGTSTSTAQPPWAISWTAWLGACPVSSDSELG
jgi:hypothetical protein